MKRRFISFLSAVVVAFMSFAQTGNVVYSWESPEGTVIETGGTAAHVMGKDSRANRKEGGYYTLCLNGKKANVADTEVDSDGDKASRIVITLDEALQEGDSIYVTAFRSKNADGAKGTIYFLYENGTEVNDDKVYCNIKSDDKDDDYDDDGATPNTHGYLVPAEAAGSKTITLSRNSSSTSVFITKFVIVRQGAEEDIPDTPVVPETVLINFAADGNCTATSGTFGDISFATDKGTASNAPAYNANSAELRVYRYTNLSFTSQEYVINKIVITCSSAGYMGGDAIEVTAGENAGTATAIAAENVVKDEDALTYTITVDEANYVNLANLGSENVQLRIKSIEVTYAKATKVKVGAPDFSVAAGNLFAAASLELTAEEGATIYWSTDNENFVAYTGAITIDATCTVYAYAEKDGVKSVVASVDYVVAVTYDNVAALLAAEATSAGVPVVVKLEATVDSLAKNSAFLVEGTDTLMIYDYNIPADYVVGNVVKGQLAGLWKDYYGTLELCNVDYSGATVEAPVTVESPWVGATIENGVTYYLYNVKAQAFLKGANDWGTRASFGVDAYPYIAEGADGVYALSSTLSFAGKYLGANLYVDSPKADFVFEKVGEGIYTFNLNGAYYAYTGANTVETVTEVNDGCYWQLLTADAIKEQMVAADAATPYHVTALITCANFGRNDGSVSAWAGGPATGGDNPNFCGEKWGAGAFDVNQTLTGLPNGTYLLQAQGYYRVGGGANDATLAAEQYVAGNPALNAILYGNDAEMPLMSIMAETKAGDAPSGDYFSTSLGYVPQNMKGASLFFNEGLYEHAMYVTVTDGTLKIGIKKSVELANDWVIFDNFRLTYYGTATVEEIELAKLQEYIDAVTVLVNVAKAIDGTLADEVKAELDAAVAVAEAALAAPAQETLVAAVAPLEAAITRAERSVAINAAASTATLTAPVAFTQFVINPDMANGTINGWTTAAGWQFQSNMVYTGEGAELNKFQERWNAGTGLGNTSTMQALKDMPNGIYRVSADVMATAQYYAADPEGHTTGAYWVANKDSVAVATANEKPERVSVDVMVTDGVLTIGLVGVNTTANWMGLDNVTVQYYGAEGSLEQLAKIEAFMNKCMELASLSESYSTMYMIPAVSAKFFAVQEPAFALVETITEVPLEEIDAQIAAMDETIAFVKAMDAKYNAWKDKLFVCYDYQDNYAASEEAVAAFAAVVDEHMTYQWSMPAETTEAMDSLVAVLDSVSRVYIEESFTFNLYAMAALYETCANMNFIPAASGKLEATMGYAGMLDTIAKVATDTIITHIAVVIETTEYVKAMDAKYAEWKEQLFVCYDYQDNATPASEASKAVLDSLVNVHMAYQWSMPATETAEIDAWIAEMKEACANYPVKVAYLCGATETTEAIYNALVAAYYNVTALNYDDVVLNDSIVNADFVGKYGVVVLAGGTGSGSNLAKAFNTLLGKVPVLSTKSFWYAKTTPAGTNGGNPGSADSPSLSLAKTVAEHPIYGGIEGDTFAVFNDMAKESGRYLQSNGQFANNEPAQTTLGTTNGADCIGEAWVGDMGWLIIPVDGAQPEGYLTEAGKALFVNAVAYLIAGEKYEAPVVEVATVTLDKTEAELTEAGATVQLTATVAPENATDKAITWTSSDEKVATVDANGLVTAVANGTATITATAANGVKAECVITVNIVDGIEAIEAVENAVIYTITGKAVQGDVKTLERGIYIINGKKVLVK